MRNSGQAMVEFVVALFAIVLLVAGIADFVAAASRHSDIAASLRGKAGAAAMSASDAEPPLPGADESEPRPEFSEGALAAGFLRKEEKESFALSRAIRDWLYSGGKDSLTVGGEVWMPPLGVKSAGKGDSP